MGKLTALKVKNAKLGKHGDEHGLWLVVQDGGAKSWVFRYMLAGRAREMGLGPAHTVSLADAREFARDCRMQLLQGIDPIDERRRRRAAATHSKTFAECAKRYIDAHKNGWTEKHKREWATSLETYAYPHIGNLPVNAIDIDEIMRVLEPIWTQKTVTATRVRGRIENVLGWATTLKYRSGDNPARWRGHLENLLGKPHRIAPVNHRPALPFVDIPEFMAALRKQTGVAARALEFTILTVMRSGEVRGCKWSEINDKLWIIPAERMKKTNREHRVPLPERAQEILEEMRKFGEIDLVFESQIRAGKPLGDQTLIRKLRDMGRKDLTVHGFRSTFKDWASESTPFPGDLSEAALAHTIRNKVQAAYERGDKLKKRERLMDAWAKYCESDPDATADVVPIKRGA